MRRKLFLTPLAVSTLVLSLEVEAQQPRKIPLIGFVSGRAAPTPANPDRTAAAFQQGLRDFGYIEGKNILVEYRYAAGMQDRWASLVAELVQSKVDVIVSPAGAAIRAAKQATKTIPVVMMITGDPVAMGLIDSFARPGGNVTGLVRLTRELAGKRLELLKEVVPKIARVGILWDPTIPVGSNPKDYEAVARALKLELQSLEVRGPNPDFDGAFQAAAKGRFSALIPLRTGVLIVNRKQIADLAIKNRLPSMYETSEEVEAGGLMSYSAKDTEIYRRAGYFVDKILKGAKTANLPVEQPAKFELVINLRTAKQIGITIPPNVLASADKVIR